MSARASATSQSDRHHLSFQQWQVWGVLLCAALTGYLSLAIHGLSKDQAEVAILLDSTQRVVAKANTQAEADRWLVELSQLLPLLRPFAGVLQERLEVPLEDLRRRAVRGDRLRPVDRLALQQQLHGVIALLTARHGSLAIDQARVTHIYYVSVLAFVIMLVALLRRRDRAGVAPSPIERLLQDNVLFANTPVSLALYDRDGRFLRVNEVFERLSGYRQAELLGREASSFEVETVGGTLSDMREQLAAKGRWVGEYRTRRKNGEVVADKVMRLSLGAIEAPAGYLTMSMDPIVSDDEKRLMLWQAHHDNLTKLPNANLLSEQLSRALLACEQEGRRGALIAIDLDRFKAVNDSIGHAEADRVLTDAALRIAMAARETDTVARVGGDRFVILLHEMEDTAEAERMARAALTSLAEPFGVQGEELHITGSAGLVIFPDDGREKGELQQKVDAARSQAKTAGGGQLVFFEEVMNTQAARRRELETRLRRAVALDEFELYYQPVIDISRNEIYGVEALLRWHNEELGMISPGEFVPIAEDTGVINEIGRWVVTEVQRQIDAWRETPLQSLKLSLNVSARQFSSEAAASELLALLGNDYTRQMIVELTESALISDDIGAALFLKGLRERGMRVALDDFGTGYSSVGYLRDFEFDVLKVDKSFIDGIDGVRDHGLVASIIAMGRILGMRVVAEGVEEASQLERLRQIGCDYVQGYYYSKPLPVGELEAFVLAWSPTEDAQAAEDNPLVHSPALPYLPPRDRP